LRKHLFVVRQDGVQTRWREAFGDLDVVADVEAALQLPPIEYGLVWLDVSFRTSFGVLRTTRPEWPLIALTLSPSADEGMLAFESGVGGYCHAMAAPEMLRQVALVVSNGGLWLGADLMNRAASALSRFTAPVPAAAAAASDPLAGLTPRERDVALIVAGGASNKEVARRLDITPRTVKAHMGTIFEKLHVRDRLQLVLALRGRNLAGSDAT